MSATPPLDPETSRLLGELIAVLAGAYREADSRGLRQPRRAGMARLAAASGSVRPLAERLAGCAAVGDYAGIDRLLGGQRTPQQWKRLAVALAFVAAGAEWSQDGPERKAS